MYSAMVRYHIAKSITGHRRCNLSCSTAHFFFFLFVCRVFSYSSITGSNARVQT